MKLYLFTIIAPILLFCTNVAAQYTLRGKIYEAQTHITLQSIRVTNLSSKQFAVSDSAGMFYINAKAGDLLAFRGYAYQPDTVVITNKNSLEIYLIPAGKELKEVNITTNQSAAGSLKDPSLNGAPVVYLRDKLGYPTGGIALRFGYGKDKKAIHNKQLSDREMVEQEIDDTFTPQKIGRLIPLRGSELQNFIFMYLPTIKVFKDPNFALTFYVNDSYKKYLSLPPEKRKPASLMQDGEVH
jgi:hypothetical protein